MKYITITIASACHYRGYIPVIIQGNCLMLDNILRN